MSKKIKKIAILTSGGDSPGMNNAVRTLVLASLHHGITPYLVYEGYKGLTEGNFKKATKDSVKNIYKQGGTIIYSARYPEFKNEATRKIAAAKLKKEGIDALVVIGGDGSYMGASLLSKLGIKTIGLPGTIDNDIPNTDFTIGFHTTLNTIVDSIEKIRDTSESHNRVNIVEVMGRHCGELAIYAAISTKVEVLSIPEKQLSKEEIFEQVKKQRKNGNRSIIVLVTEKLFDANQLAKEVEANTGIETRATILGHSQRGGMPANMDRFYATILAESAIEHLLKGKTSIALGVKNGGIISTDILKVVKMKRPSVEHLIRVYEEIK